MNAQVERVNGTLCLVEPCDGIIGDDIGDVAGLQNDIHSGREPVVDTVLRGDHTGKQRRPGGRAYRRGAEEVIGPLTGGRKRVKMGGLNPIAQGP